MVINIQHNLTIQNGDLMENRKKIAAAVSGALAFIKAQEEMAHMQAAASLPAAVCATSILGLRVTFQRSAGK